jgi:predicted nucleic acid-binding protein
MIGLDTNVLARYLLDDEPCQSLAARRLLERAETRFWVPVTVLLELAWVLKSRGVPRGAVVEAMGGLAALPNVHLQFAQAVLLALQFADGGLEVADALHLALCDRAERFVSFDDHLIRLSRKLSTNPIVQKVGTA